MTPPLISICVPNLNKRPFLIERLESILAQTTKDWEMVVCDSFSDDGSWELLQKFRNDSRIALYQVPREGLYAGWNECLRRASGKYVYIATSDDSMAPNALERLVEPLELNPQIDLSVCEHLIVDRESRPIPGKTPKFHQAVWAQSKNDVIRSGLTEFLLHACSITIWLTMNSILFRRTLLEKVGLFRTDQGTVADVEWSLKAALSSDVAVVPEQLVTWRSYLGQATAAVSELPIQRTLYHSLLGVLDQHEDQIPLQWRQHKSWRKEIARVRRARYIVSYELYRWRAREKPSFFAKRVLEAAKHDPAILLSRAAHGFRSGPELNIEGPTVFAELVREFGLEWPPCRSWRDNR